MRALSLWQPWAHAVTHLGKRIENRTSWRATTPALAVARKLVGSTIAIHASKGVGTRVEFDDAAEFILGVVKPTQGPERLAVMHAFAQMEVQMRGKRHGEGTWVPATNLPRMAIVGRARLAAIHDHGNMAGHRYPDKGVKCMGCGYERPTVAQLVAGPCDPGPFECPKRDPWAMTGGFGLLLADVEALAAPVPFAGGQGFFEVPDAIMIGGAS